MEKSLVANLRMLILTVLLGSFQTDQMIFPIWSTAIAILALLASMTAISWTSSPAVYRIYSWVTCCKLFFKFWSLSSSTSRCRGKQISSDETISQATPSSADFKNFSGIIEANGKNTRSSFGECLGKKQINFFSIFHSQHPKAGLRALLMKQYWIQKNISGLFLLPLQLLQNTLIMAIRCYLTDLSIFILMWLHFHWLLLHPMSCQDSLGNQPPKQREPKRLDLFGKYFYSSGQDTKLSSHVI